MFQVREISDKLDFTPAVLNWGGAPSQGDQKISRGGVSPTCSTTWNVFEWNVPLPNVTPVLILRPYMLFGLVPEEMEVVFKFCEILQAEFEPACKHSGAKLGGFFSRHAKSF